MTTKPLPPGFHPMHELPVPGKARMFMFEIPGEGRKVSEARTMTACICDPTIKEGPQYRTETLSPIAWRYR